ncbi:MAG: PUA domain-containing protein [Candidatus Bathyarchaeia archaeon]
MRLRFFDLQKIRSVANYQFARGVGVALFPDGVEMSYSRRTGRIRHVYLNGVLLATLRPKDGMFSLTIAGARRMASILPPPRMRVVVREDVERFIVEGGNVFAKHVVGADPEIRPQEEVIVTNSKDEVLAVGRALLTGREMPAFKRGVAVRTRKGAEEG